MLTLYSQGGSPDGISSTSNSRDETPETVVRDIHALNPAPSRTTTTALPPPPAFRGYFSPTRSTMSEGASSGENFTSVSREFNALVIAGSSMGNNNEPTGRNVAQPDDDERQQQLQDLMRIREEREEEETNPLAIVPDPVSENGSSGQVQGRAGMTSVQRVKREEVEAKITAWQTAKLAKINNRFKREDAVINGWVKEQVHKANSWMKKIEVDAEEARGEKSQGDGENAKRRG